MYRCCAMVIGLLMLESDSWAADPPTFPLQKGQELHFKVVQSTLTRETTLDDKTGKPMEQEHTTKANVSRRWTVTEVDDKGVATMEMTITAMRWEQKLPNGEMDVFDSAKPDDLNKNEMAKLIGSVQAIVRIDPRGQLVEVKKGNAGRFAADLPFKIVHPEKEVAEGGTWERTFKIKLDPPQGTGETYDAIQKYTAKPAVNGYYVVGIQTTVKDMPKEAADQIPLLPILTEGDVYLHPKTGEYRAARFQWKKELANHAGEGTKYFYESTYSENFVPPAK